MGWIAPNRANVALAARLRQMADWLAAAMFAAVFLIFNYKIFTRYFEHDEAVWADEVLVILFIWIIFWAQCLRACRDQRSDHIRSRLPAAAAARPSRGGAGAYMRWSAASFCGRCPARSATSSSFGASTRRCSICRSISVYSCFGLFLVAVIVRSLLSVRRLLGSRWADEI